MKPDTTSNPGSEIQLFYARLLDRAAKCLFLLVIFTFFLYVSGIPSSYVPLERLPQYWSQPLSQYLQMTNLKPGWKWLTYVYYGDVLTFLPIFGLAGIAIFSYLCLAAKFLRHRDHFMGWIAILEIIILIIAASGILMVGGH
jgi:hypothetical protein